MDETKKNIYLRVVANITVLLAVLGLAYLGGPLALEILTPFLVAFIMAWIFNPAIRGLQSKLGFTRKLFSFIMVILFYVILGFMFVWFATLLIDQIIGLTRALPTIIPRLQESYYALLSQIRLLLDHLPAGYEAYETQLFIALDRAWQWGISFLTQLLSMAASWTSNAALSLPEYVIFLTVLILASCFITADFPNLRENIKQRLTLSTRRSISLLSTSFKNAIFGFFRSQLIFAVIDMGIILIFFFFMKMSYPLPIALLLAFLDFLPFFGAGTVIVPWGLVCLLIGYTNTGFQLLLLYGILYVFRRIFEPRVLGGQTGFSSLQMLFSMYAGMKLYGITGLILAPIIWIAAVNFWRTGILDGFFSDLKIIAIDVRNLMTNPLTQETLRAHAEKQAAAAKAAPAPKGKKARKK